MIWMLGTPDSIEHPFFGTMVDADEYYECQRYFTPIKDSLKLAVYKSDGDSFTKQIEFFHWLENNFEELFLRLSPTFTEILQSCRLSPDPSKYRNDFVLEYAQIPPGSYSDKIEWQIVFYENNQLHHWCTLEMKGYKVIEYTVDG